MSIPAEEHTLISIVTPVYNGEHFVQKAYNCLTRQTHTDWEWVVVDDGSTDYSFALLSEIAKKDSRVRLFSQRPSGSAKQPRDHAVAEAKGLFILPLDIDDRLDDDYLAVMLNRMLETQADIVYPKMVFVNLDNGQVTSVLPTEDFDTSQVYTGRELVKDTAPEWRIGCNGGLYRHNIWVNSSWPEKHEPIWMNSDEVDERLYLLQAQRVAFSQACYFYQNHQASITSTISPKLFHTQKTNIQLIDLAAREFGPGSTEYQRMQRKAFCDWRWKMSLYVRNHRQLDFADAEIHQNLATCFKKLDKQVLTRGERIQFANLCSFPLVLALFCLRYSPALLVEKAMQRLCPNFYGDKVIRRRTEQKMREQLEASYTEKERKDVTPVVVSMFCGNTESGGLVDRLRGAVSLYQACRETNRDFRLFFNHPFLLEDYLEPAVYDWRIKPGEICFNREQVRRIVAQSVTGHENHEHLALFNKELSRHQGHQVHVYSNAAFCYDKDFGHDFGQLFKPSKKLAEHLEAIRGEIGRSYITVSARFCNLLDDFNEEVYSEPLPYDERDKLISGCLQQIGTLKEKHKGQTVVVCSDSITFLRKAQTEMGAYIIPGTVSHIGNDKVHDYEYYEKTFLDFFTIAHANHVYLLRGPGMHNSGFPYAAALTEGRPFQIINFQTD